MFKRTHTCGGLSLDNLDEIVSLNGWISKSRDLGGLTFIDLRDRYGKTQIVFNEDISAKSFELVKDLGLEDVIGITGQVVARPADAINNDISTGEIDIEVHDVIVYNESDNPPFDINDRQSASENHRLKYLSLIHI